MMLVLKQPLRTQALSQSMWWGAILRHTSLPRADSADHSAFPGKNTTDFDQLYRLSNDPQHKGDRPQQINNVTCGYPSRVTLFTHHVFKWKAITNQTRWNVV